MLVRALVPLQALLLICAVWLTGCTNQSPPVQSPPVGVLGVVGCSKTDTETFAPIADGWQNIVDYPRGLQKIIVASDPQPWRVMTSRSPYLENGEDSDRWFKLMAELTPHLQAERDEPYYVPLIINGDITEFGHKTERAAVHRTFKGWAARANGPVILPGLGNHDYDQNVGNCSNNGCARDAVCDHLNWTHTLTPKNMDYGWVSSESKHTGSLSYSVNVGRVHIVQLNLEPTYTKYFETGGNAITGPKVRFNITSAMEWLANDLREAKAKGLYTIINLHSWYGWKGSDAEFKKLVAENDVVAIFAGHLHDKLGFVKDYNGVPFFQDGALLALSYLRLTFDWSNYTLTVRNVTLDNSNSAEKVINLRRPPTTPGLTVTLYRLEGQQSDSCTLQLSKGQTAYLRRGDYPSCSRLDPKSAKVVGFSAGNRICFRDEMDQASACFQGSFTGTLNINNLDSADGLPSGMTLTRKRPPVRGYVRALTYRSNN